MAGVLLIGAAALLVQSPIGKRIVAEQIASIAPASGLRFEVGRIEGDVFSKARLHDLVVLDQHGEFLTIPEASIDWRPLAYLWRGLDVREVTASRGTLLRLPELLPGDPDAPILPDFDIRVDRLAIDDLRLAPDLSGSGSRTANLLAHVDIRKGFVRLEANGDIGEGERLALILRAEPDADLFDLDLDFTAPKGGAVDTMTGLESGYRARISGQGRWAEWRGHSLIERQRATGWDTVGAFSIGNTAGQIAALGQLWLSRATDEAASADLLGSTMSLAATGQLSRSVWDGSVRAVNSAFDLGLGGRIDLAGNEFEQLAVKLNARKADIFGDGVFIDGATLEAEINGPFRNAAIDHIVRVASLEVGDFHAKRILQEGGARRTEAGWELPLNLSADEIVSGSTWLDEQTRGAQAVGELTIAGTRVAGDDLSVRFGPVTLQFDLLGDLADDNYRASGTLTAEPSLVSGLGQIGGIAKFVATAGVARPWAVRANFVGEIDSFASDAVGAVLGTSLEARGALSVGETEALILRNVSLQSDQLDANLDSRLIGETISIVGSGEHRTYGPMAFEGSFAQGDPRATIVLASPQPALGLRDVTLAIAPSDPGLAVETSGASLLGPFDGRLALSFPEDRPVELSIEQFRVWQTDLLGKLFFQEDGASGDLAIRGGGLSGSMTFSPDAEGQTLALALTARDARFGGETQLSLGNAQIDLSGSLSGQTLAGSGQITGSALRYGQLYLDRFAADGMVLDGVGQVTASIAGRRAERFALQMSGEIEPQRISVLAQGNFAGRSISMPRRAVLDAKADGGWKLAPAQLSIGRGFAILEGDLGGDLTALEARLSGLPLVLADLVTTDFGLGGRLTGTASYRHAAGAQPTGDVRAKVEGLTRSGLVLSSRPIDALAVIELGQNALTGGIALREGSLDLGKVSGAIELATSDAGLLTRITQGRVDAKAEYEGPAQSLWRLLGLETIDLSGPVSLGVSVRGALDQPQLTGLVRGDGLRLQSPLSGTDITGLRARGELKGSRFYLRQASGNTRNGGSIAGSGTFDFDDLQAPSFDIRASASGAELVNIAGLRATLTGPLRIRSNGNGGVVAGRLTINSGSWRLGNAIDDRALPEIETREINRNNASAVRTTATSASWRYLIDARAPRGLKVDGLGLESEWAADISLRGAISDPRVGGEARLVDGDYVFAGVQFDLTRGRIGFDQNTEIDPRLDLIAEANRNGVDVAVEISGTSQRPEIAFSSQPDLPQEEILAQLLFGGSVASLSATDALQLGAALASLQAGGGLDPINRLRRSIGLDQLRIVAADPALNRGTGVAVGKNINSRLYAEFVTDGRDYSATSVEFRVSRWLSLLGTISGLGRNGVVMEFSRDY